MAKPAKTLENVFSKALTLCFSSNKIGFFFFFAITPFSPLTYPCNGVEEWQLLPFISLA